MSNNCVLPFIETRTDRSLIIFITETVKRLLKEFLLFGKNECLKRETTGEIPYQWDLLCKSRSVFEHHYSPRCTFPVFYFGGRY